MSEKTHEERARERIDREEQRAKRLARKLGINDDDKRAYNHIRFALFMSAVEAQEKAFRDAHNMWKREIEKLTEDKP